LTADVEIFGHLLPVYDQAAKHKLRLMQAACSQHKASGNRHPLGMPWSGGALKILHQFGSDDLIFMITGGRRGPRTA
jgi:hypothetical protein